MSDQDKTPPRGPSTTSLLLSGLGATWSRIRHLGSAVDEALDEKSREIALNRLERLLALLGDDAHKVRVTLRQLRERKEATR